MLIRVSWKITSVSVISKQAMNKCDQIDIKLVIIAEVTQVFLPIWSADTISDGVLSPVSGQHLTSWKRALSFDSRTRLGIWFRSEEKKQQKQAKWRSKRSALKWYFNYWRISTSDRLMAATMASNWPVSHLCRARASRVWSLGTPATTTTATTTRYWWRYWFCPAWFQTSNLIHDQ